MTGRLPSLLPGYSCCTALASTCAAECRMRSSSLPAWLMRANASPRRRSGQPGLRGRQQILLDAHRGAKTIETQADSSFDGADRRRELGGDFGMTQPAEIRQFDYLLLLGWQRVQRDPGGLGVDVRDGLGRDVAGIRWIQPLRQGLNRAPPPGSQDVDGSIADHGQDPGVGRAAARVVGMTRP